MSPTRTLARPMLAAVFVTSGIDVLRNPGPRAAKAESVAVPLAARVGLPQDPELLVRLNAATQLAAGTLLAMGKFRRLSALALMASLVPTTYAGHPFWEVDDPRERSQQQVHFLKNLAVLGGLLLEVVDTEGRPSLGWRSRRAAQRAATVAAASVPAGKAVRAAVESAAAVRTAGAAGDAAAARVAKGISGVAGKAKGATAVTGLASGLVRDAAKTDAVAHTAARAKKLARQAAQADLVTDVAARARDLTGSAAKLKATKELVAAGMGA